MTDFAGVSFGVNALSAKSKGQRVAVIASSAGFVAHKVDGMTTREVLACLLEMQSAKGKEQGVYVTYDTAIDYELILQDLSRWDKDKLFGIWRAKEEEVKDTPLYNPDRTAESVEYQGIKLHYITGKIFKLRRLNSKRKGLTIYDVAGYFDHVDSATAANRYLGEMLPLPLVERNELKLWQGATLDALIERCECEARLTKRLAEKVEAVIEPLNLPPMRQWYGPSAIAAKCLNQWKARGQAKRLTERNSPHELIQAIDRAYFGGRVEAVKLGTLYGLTVVDINSAYAYATALLAQFHQRFCFTRRPQRDDLSNPLSVWLVDYELPKDTVIGVLPTRAPMGAISFRLKGRGYYWQPEVDYLRKHFPGHYRIYYGYVARDAEPVTFAGDIHRVYDYRMALKAQGDAGQNIIKLALASLYGKFAQNQGAAWFQCRTWAGWITSYIRRMLLDAVTGIEDKVISFNQDAVHLEAGAVANVSIGEGLGQWKYQRYESGLYVAPGIYELLTAQDARAKGKGQRGKRATRGVNLDLDFDRIAKELSDNQAAELARTFFCGWQLARMAPVKYERHYLQDLSETLRILPLKLKARNYDPYMNWLTESRTSTINASHAGTLSAQYHPGDQGVSLALRLRLKDRGWA